MFYIYCLQNLLNSKIYVGKSAKPLQRLKTHISIANGAKPREFSLIHAAIKKHGIDNFKFQIIEEWANEEDAYEAEEFWIAFLQSHVGKHGKEAGYNISPGRTGFRSGSDNPMFGRRYTEEERLIMSVKTTGQLNPNFGKLFSLETKNLMSDLKKDLYLGENNPRAKLTNSQAEEIRANTHMSINEMSIKYGVKRNVIERVLRGETYKGNK